MPYFDLPRHELASYQPDLAWPADADDFWSRTLQESRALARPPVWDRAPSPFTVVDTYDVTFSGFGGQPVRAWLHLPAGLEASVPAVVRYQGYGGGRGLGHQVDIWALAGYASMVMDTRGQGSAWSPGDTPDPVGSGPAHPGFMTRGINSPEDYYYRRVYTDAVLAIDAVRQHPLVQASKVAACGASQGGGITLAVAGLVPDLWAAMSDVPFLCDFRRASEVSPKDPYGEIVRYLKVHRDQVDKVFRTLSYFDAASLGKKAKAPALFSVGLMDEICPPSTVYAAYNGYGAKKSIVVYPFNTHEGGEVFHQKAQLEWLAALAAGAGGS
jgi:cephalosporin-C deacetylase